MTTPNFCEVLDRSEATHYAALVDAETRRIRLSDALDVLDGLQRGEDAQYLQALAEVLRAARRVVE